MREVIEKTWGWDEAWQRNDFDRRFSEYVVSTHRSFECGTIRAWELFNPCQGWARPTTGVAAPCEVR